MPRPSADHAVLENVFAAIDKLTLARHVADFPMMRQTSPTSPSTPRATTGSSSQRFPTRRHAPKNRILTRNAPRPAREFLVEGRDSQREEGRREGGGAERRRQRARLLEGQNSANRRQLRRGPRLKSSLNTAIGEEGGGGGVERRHGHRHFTSPFWASSEAKISAF
ncbi:hypothetical protein EV121DRAFT_297880 [Schizophyllum commune]